jgi:hypothetical protein
MSGCSVNVTNPEIIDLNDLIDCRNKNDQNINKECKISNGIDNMYLQRKIKWFSMFQHFMKMMSWY